MPQQFFLEDEHATTVIKAMFKIISSQQQLMRN
jgi:hypothetical protein